MAGREGGEGGERERGEDELVRIKVFLPHEFCFIIVFTEFVGSAKMEKVEEEASASTRAETKLFLKYILVLCRMVVLAQKDLKKKKREFRGGCELGIGYL